MCVGKRLRDVVGMLPRVWDDCCSVERGSGMVEESVVCVLVYGVSCDLFVLVLVLVLVGVYVSWDVVRCVLRCVEKAVVFESGIVWGWSEFRGSAGDCSCVLRVCVC